jgi:hypothetical protein
MHESRTTPPGKVAISIERHGRIHGRLYACAPGWLYKHLDFTTTEVVSRLKKDWTADIQAYDQGHDHMLMFADMLTEGIVKQFPSKFSHSQGIEPPRGMALTATLVLDALGIAPKANQLLICRIEISTSVLLSPCRLRWMQRPRQSSIPGARACTILASTRTA